MRDFGELEAVVMRRMWEPRTPVTVREMVENLRRDREIAYTTVLTVMANLFRKGFLRREIHGRAYRYCAVTSREECGAMAMREALDDCEDRALALQHFAGSISADEAQALRVALSARSL